jgi:hypothetical protein
MKDFQKIDWKLYNRPPFYQQWLCKEDTLKLATFGDGGLAEVDDQVLALKNQWDLENVKGHFIDRIGKLLSEYRNGNTDEYYRILLKLRRLLNTNDGSIPSVIKAIKFLYSSEVVHIVPDYPAGLIINHDGEGTPGIDFNKILREVIPAGVAYSTKELFYFSETTRISESHQITFRNNIVEEAFGKIYHNGRILRDGHTVRSTEKVLCFRNGRFRHDGEIDHKKLNIVKARSFIRLPLRHSSGLQERLNLTVKSGFNDAVSVTENFLIGMRYHRFHNGKYTRNGQIKHNTFTLIPLE